MQRVDIWTKFWTVWTAAFFAVTFIGLTAGPTHPWVVRGGVALTTTGILAVAVEMSFALRDQRGGR